jgi:transposase
MSQEELGRHEVIQKVIHKQLKQRAAASQLGVSVRQIRRLVRAVRKSGAKGLISQQRGRASNHQLSSTIKTQAVELVRSRYPDFGPTLAHEKLTEEHHLQLSVEMVRQLMIRAELWKPHRARRVVLHPLRERRARCGELVQIDGSPFAWFEDRAPACTLLVFIDDATGRLMELHFTAAESTFSYFEATEHYLTRWGKPVAFYSDKLSVFRINAPNDLTGTGATQFTRAMYQLGIQVICANTPQAKGRVERANETLQDRLVKEMRLRGISSMAAGNAYEAEFREKFNARFAVAPRSAEDAHRPLLPQDDLARILTVQELRVLSKNLTLQYDKVIYQIYTSRPTYALRNAQVVVRENRHGEITIEYQGKPLQYGVYRRQMRAAEEVSSKQISLALEPLSEEQPQPAQRKPYIPPADHPWRRFRISNKGQ